MLLATIQLQDITKWFLSHIIQTSVQVQHSELATVVEKGIFCKFDLLLNEFMTVIHAWQVTSSPQVCAMRPLSSSQVPSALTLRG